MLVDIIAIINMHAACGRRAFFLRDSIRAWGSVNRGTVFGIKRTFVLRKSYVFKGLKSSKTFPLKLPHSNPVKARTTNTVNHR